MIIVGVLMSFDIGLIKFDINKNIQSLFFFIQKIQQIILNKSNPSSKIFTLSTQPTFCSRRTDSTNFFILTNIA